MHIVLNAIYDDAVHINVFVLFLFLIKKMLCFAAQNDPQAFVRFLQQEYFSTDRFSPPAYYVCGVLEKNLFVKDVIQLVMEYVCSIERRRTNAQLRILKFRRAICEISLLSIPSLWWITNSTFQRYSMARFTTVSNPTSHITLDDLQPDQKHIRSELKQWCARYSEHFYVYDCGHAVYDIALMYRQFCTTETFESLLKTCSRCEKDSRINTKNNSIIPLNEVHLYANQLQVGDVIDCDGYRAVGYYIYEGIVEGSPTFLRVPTLSGYGAVWPLYYLKLRGYAYYYSYDECHVDAWLFSNGYAYTIGNGFEEWNKRFTHAGTYRLQDNTKKKKRKRSFFEEHKENDPCKAVAVIESMRRWTSGHHLVIPLSNNQRFEILANDRRITLMPWYD